MCGRVWVRVHVPHWCARACDQATVLTATPPPAPPRPAGHEEPAHGTKCGKHAHTPLPPAPQVMKNPPAGVKLVMHAICIMLGCLPEVLLTNKAAKDPEFQVKVGAACAVCAAAPACASPCRITRCHGLPLRRACTHACPPARPTAPLRTNTIIITSSHLTAAPLCRARPGGRSPSAC